MVVVGWAEVRALRELRSDDHELTRDLTSGGRLMPLSMVNPHKDVDVFGDLVPEKPLLENGKLE